METVKVLNIKYGWGVHDVVAMYKTWCVICAIARWHETYANKTVCLACTNVFDAELKAAA